MKVRNQESFKIFVLDEDAIVITTTFKRNLVKNFHPKSFKQSYKDHKNASLQ